MMIMSSQIFTHPLLMATLALTFTLTAAHAEQHPIPAPDSNDPCWTRIEPLQRFTFKGPLLEHTDLRSRAEIT